MTEAEYQQWTASVARVRASMIQFGQALAPVAKKAADDFNGAFREYGAARIRQVTATEEPRDG